MFFIFNLQVDTPPLIVRESNGQNLAIDASSSDADNFQDVSSPKCAVTSGTRMPVPS